MKRNHEAEVGLPPREFTTAHDMDARLRTEGDWVAVKGTGSMAPYIPAGDPKATVAWVKVENCDFESLNKNELVVFNTENFGLILHQLAKKTAAGWITSGLHNSNYDSTRVYPENFRGRVVKTYILIP